MGNIMEEAFTAYTGSEKVFTLNGKELVIPARFDAFIMSCDLSRSISESVIAIVSPTKLFSFSSITPDISQAVELSLRTSFW